MPGTAARSMSLAGSQTWEYTYPGRADQLRPLRAALVEQLGACIVADDVILVAHELAANAIAHSDSAASGGSFTVRLEHIAGISVQAEVTDEGSGWNGSIEDSAEPAHGLCILQALAAACGTRRTGVRQWTVWFRIDYPASHSGSNGDRHPECSPPVRRYGAAPLSRDERLQG